MITMIAAIGDHKAIGVGDRLPWHLPNDLAWFKANTLHRTVVYGRKTLESLSNRTLPQRENLILTTKPWEKVGDKAAHMVTKDYVLQRAKVEEVMVIGGGQVYEAMLPHADKLILTRVYTSVPNATAFFPHFEDHFERVYQSKLQECYESGLGYRIGIYHRLPECN